MTNEKSSSERPPFWRRRFLIIPAFQLRLIFWNILISLFIFAIVLFQIARAMNELTQMGTSAGFPSDHPYFTFVRELSGNFYVYVSVAFIVGIALSWLITLFVSHRFAGPIYRLRKFFDGIAKGEAVSEIRFRKNDYLADFAPIINDALKRVSK
ncbi:MAG: methyl-accepting chemotaxis protein [Deltaproteobacteria bacterium]|nr:methyl-accepting chemotaxis protein [Deltaproteobacteria bacterium]